MHIRTKIAKFYFTFVQIYKKYAFSMKNRLASILSAVSAALLSGLAADAASALKTDPAVSSGMLDCGLAYYLVSNPSEAGTADFALVSKFDGNAGSSAETDIARACLDSLPHFAHRSPMDFLQDNGIAYPRNGYVSVLEDAALYHFRNVSLSRTDKIADSTLLMLFDIAARAASSGRGCDSISSGIASQALIVSGDIDRDAVLKKLDVMSLMLNMNGMSADRPVKDTVKLTATVADTLETCIYVDSIGNVAYVQAVFYSPQIPRNRRGSSLSLVSSRFWNEFRSAAEVRISSFLRQEKIPYSNIRLARSAMSGSGDYDKYSISAGVAPEDTSRVKSILVSVLSDLRYNGLGEEEYRCFRSISSRNMYFRSVSPSRANSDYVMKCADAFIYGAGIISARDEADFFLSSGLSDSTGRRLLNKYISAILPDNIAKEQVYYGPRRTFAMADTLLLTSWQQPMKVRKTREMKNSGSLVWYFPNGIRVIYKKMPTDGMLYYSWVMRGGFSSVPDLKPGEGAFYSDLLFKGDVCGMRSSDFRRMLSAEGISMNCSAGVTDTRIYGSAPFNRLTLLMKSLLSLSETYSEDDALGNYYLECERLRLSSMRGEYVTRLAAIDSIMSPGYIYSGNKSVSGLYPDLPERAGQFYRGQFSRTNDGALVLAGDMEAYDVRKVLEDFMGGFRTSPDVARRPNAHYRYVSGWSTYVSDGRSNSIDVVSSARLILTSSSYMSAQIVTMAVRDAASRALAGLGMTVNVSGTFSQFPHERYTVYISAVPARISSLPASVGQGSYFACLYSIRKALSELAEKGLDKDDVEMYKRILSDSYKSRQEDPGYWVRVVSDRIATGKNLDAGYEEKIAAVSEESVNNVLTALYQGSQVEYVIKKDN